MTRARIRQCERCGCVRTATGRVCSPCRDRELVGWSLCAECAQLIPVNRQSHRKHRIPLHSCNQRIESERAVVCLNCHRLNGRGRWCSAKCWSSWRYQHHEPHKAAVLTRIHAKRAGGKPHDLGITARAIARREGDSCYLCFTPVDWGVSPYHPLSPTIDHKVPLSMGGTHTWDNVKLAHRGCNSAKGTKIFIEAPDETIATGISG